MPGKKDLLATALRYSGTNQVLRAVGGWRGLVVLNYHRIGDPIGSLCDHGVYSATVESFNEQLTAITRHCDVIGVKDLDRALLDRRGRYALITFDDGYRDNYAAAFPVLKDHRLPAVFFLTTGFLDDRLLAWWDEIAWMVRVSPRAQLPENRWTAAPVAFDSPHRESAVRALLATFKQLPWDETQPFVDWIAEASGSGRCPQETASSVWMTWEMVREMRASGMDFGGHTVTHPILARLNPEQQWREISRSKQRIEAELDESIDAFSYPVGAPDCFDKITRSCLDRAGYRFAFSFHGGFAAAAHDDRLDIPRYPMDPILTPARVEALLTLPQLFATT